MRPTDYQEQEEPKPDTNEIPRSLRPSPEPAGAIAVCGLPLWILSRRLYETELPLVTVGMVVLVGVVIGLAVGKWYIEAIAAAWLASRGRPTLDLPAWSTKLTSRFPALFPASEADRFPWRQTVAGRRFLRAALACVLIAALAILALVSINPGSVLFSISAFSHAFLVGSTLRHFLWWW